MTIIFLLIPLGLVLTGLAIWAFFWAVGDGQFDDLESPAWEVLRDDSPPTRTDGAAGDPSAPRSARREP